MDLFEGLKSFRTVNEAQVQAQDIAIYNVGIEPLSEEDFAGFYAMLDKAEMQNVYNKDNKSLQVMTKYTLDQFKEFLAKDDKYKSLDVSLAEVKDFNATWYTNPKTGPFVRQIIIEQKPEELPTVYVDTAKAINNKLIEVDTKIQNSAHLSTDEINSLKSEFDTLKKGQADLKKDVSAIIELLNKKTPIRKKRADAGKPRESVNQKLAGFMKTLIPQLEAIEKRINKVETDLGKKFDEFAKDMKDQLDNVAKKDDITELKIQLADTAAVVNSMKQNQSVSPEQLNALVKAVNTAKTKAKMSDEDLQKESKKAAPAAVAKKIYIWNRKVHKETSNIKEEYLFFATLLTQIKDSNPEEYEKLKKYLDESAKTKIALVDAIKKSGGKETKETDTDTKETDKADETQPKDDEIDSIAPEEDTKSTDPNAEVAVDLGAKKKLKGNIYEYVFILKLGERKHYNNLEKLKTEDTKTHEEDLVASILNKMSNAGHDLFGYEPQGYITAVIAKYSDVRDFAGTMAQWSSKNSIGVLAAIAGGGVGILANKRKELSQKGMNFGENIGKYLKYELTGEVKDLNPVVADIENDIRSTLNLDDRIRYDYEVAKKRQDINTKKRATKYLGTAPKEKKMYQEQQIYLENDGPAGGQGIGGQGMEPVGPNPSGSFGAMGTNFNVPGMLNGAGNPLPATRTSDGSMDKYDKPIIKKKKKKKKKKVINEEIVDFETFCRNK